MNSFPAGEPLHGIWPGWRRAAAPRMAGRRARQSDGRDGAPRPGVPSTTLLARDAKTGALVGMIDIRHRLNDFLLGPSAGNYRLQRGASLPAAQGICHAHAGRRAGEVCRELGLPRDDRLRQRKRLSRTSSSSGAGGVFGNEAPGTDRLTRATGSTCRREQREAHFWRPAR